MKHALMRLGKLVAQGLFAGWCTVSAGAGITNLTPVADTFLSQNFPSNDFGGMPHVSAGTTQEFKRNRALFRFDVAGALRDGSQVLSAKLVLELTGEPVDGFNFADFGLHRMLQPWGEGSQTNAPGLGLGRGAPAATNEATWFLRFAFTPEAWGAPGGAMDHDYTAAASAMQTIYGFGDSPYEFGPTSQTVADVQSWLDDPARNFGWMLLCHAEETDFTARRFGSREDARNRPQLLIDYLVAPRIDAVVAFGGELHFSFIAAAGQTHVVEYREAVTTGLWQTLTNLDVPAETTRITVSDPLLATPRFYRVVSF